LFFLNPDAEIVSQNISAVIREFASNPVLGILGSRVVAPDGKVQKWIAGSKISLWNILKNNLNVVQDEKCWQNEKVTEVFWVAGTALFICRDLFFELGGFDEKFFLYFEDVDLCNRAHQLKRKVFYFPGFSVLHHGGKSFLGKKKQKGAYYLSQDYYFQKHFGSFQATLLKFLRFFSF
jgi:GT2 family glycosyltransferase